MSEMAEFKKNVNWYDANQSYLASHYHGQYVGVCDEHVCGIWPDMMSGLTGMVSAGYKPGDFIVQLCVPKEEESTFVCHTDNPFRNPVSLF